LDNAKVINGPAQVYLGSQHQVLGIKLHPSNIAYEVQKKGTNRSWLDVWPMVCSTFISNQTSAFRKFYEWSDVTGKSKTYKASPLTI
jgi:hypothetical protein